MRNERVSIIIDGSNFYHRLKETGLSDLLKFDYARFANFLAGKRKIIAKKYYIGAIREEARNKKSKELRRNQRIFIGKIKNRGWHVVFGTMMKNGGYHEKGVDVHIAVDILVGAYENLYDTLIIVSSDTDLIPALAKARSMHRQVEYIGFSHKPSHAIIEHSDVRKLLTKEELEQFISTSS